LSPSSDTASAPGNNGRRAFATALLVLLAACSSPPPPTVVHAFRLLVGTVSQHGSHLHLTLGDGSGHVLGGHLLDGCKVYTTAEVVLVESTRHVFTRAKDGSTPWAELQVGFRR
jgi:hypothetical protein